MGEGEQRTWRTDSCASKGMSPAAGDRQSESERENQRMSMRNLDLEFL